MKSKVKFEDAKTMLFSFVDSFQNWLFSFDMKSGYHHIDIFPPEQEFLGFSWFEDGFAHFYKFTVLLLGPSTGPYIFTQEGGSVSIVFPYSPTVNSSLPV